MGGKGSGRKPGQPGRRPRPTTKQLAKAARLAADHLARKESWWQRERLVREAYSNPSYAERQCDRCGQSYRGPAVYCSLDCAVADA